VALLEQVMGDHRNAFNQSEYTDLYAALVQRVTA
jgi:hypothetical protein